MTSTVQIESDEEMARRLQEQELELGRSHLEYNHLRINSNNSNNNNTEQERLNRRNINRDNPTVINSRLNELSSARVTVIAIFIIHFPQVIDCRCYSSSFCSC